MRSFFWFVGVCMGAHRNEEIKVKGNVTIKNAIQRLNIYRNTKWGIVLETYNK